MFERPAAADNDKARGAKMHRLNLVVTTGWIAGTLAVAGCYKPAQTEHGSRAAPITNAAGTVSAGSLADKLTAAGIDSGGGFSVTRPMTCGKAPAPQDPSVHCETLLSDAARSGRSADLTIMIFEQDADYAARAAQIKPEVAAMPGRWSLEDNPKIGITNKRSGEKVSLETACYQSRGRPNSDAYCLVQANPRVLVLASVTPARATSDGINVGGDSDSYDDTGHAVDLASLGVLAVAGVE